MFYEPKKNDHSLSKNPFKSCTVPRVIGWISTKNEDGSDNLAPYSQFTNLTFDPPMVIFAANQNVFGDRKNTVKNIERTGEFVYNMVSYDLKDAMNASSIAKLPEGYADKFEYSGVTKAPSQLIDVARVAESPIQYECKYVTTFRLPAIFCVSSDLQTRFFIAIICISQIIMFSTTIPMVLATKIPLTVKDMVIVWFERTIVSIILAAIAMHIFIA